MKKILTIDFDIIMHNSIDLYNDKVPTKDWDELKKIPFMEYIFGDLNLYKTLTEFLLNQTSNLKAENFHFITAHD